MYRNRFVSSLLLASLLVAAGIVSLMGLPAASVFAEEPSPIPTKDSNTTIAVEVSKTTVNPGDPFDLNITIDTNAQTWGAQFDLTFDPKLVQITSSSDGGGFYKDYAAAHNGSFLLVPQPQIDNKVGKISTTGVSSVSLQPGSGGPTGKGVLITFHGKAVEGAQGTATFKLSNILVSDAGDATGVTAALGGVKAQDGVLAVGGSGPAPTMAAQVATAPGPQSGSAPTLEPTIAKRTSLDTPGTDNSGSSIPWVIIIPVVGIVVIGGGAFVVTRKK